MRKYGKYEKKPGAAAGKGASVKSALLQTYFTSLLCLVLCVSMFLGTSYAWFTSEVTNTANEIYIGTLDVGLFKVEATGEGTQEVDLSVEGKLFDSNVRWEPGYTAIETIRVVNEGDLAFQYALSFTDGAAWNAGGEAAEPEAVAGFFDVWVYDYYDQGNVAPTLSSYQAITEEGSGWVYAGSLEQLLEGKTVLEGNMLTVRDGATGEQVATADTYTIALHMKEDADESVMGHRISLSVKLVAYQKGSETDGFGNGDYDRLAVTESDLQEGFRNGGRVTLLGDILLTQGLTVESGRTVILELNGHSITGAATEEMPWLINNLGNLTVNGAGEIAVTHDGSSVGGAAVNAIRNAGVLTVNGGRISNTNTGGNAQIGYGIDNYNGAALTVNGGEITASGSAAYDGIRLFCGSNETVVTVNGGTISSVWAQNPSTNEADPVLGTVIINAGAVGTTYYEKYTTVKVASGVTADVTPYGAGSDNVRSEEADGYTVYSFVLG